MPPVQTSYQQYFSPAIAGLVANMEPSRLMSREVQTATGMTYGVVALQGTGDNQVRTVADAVANGGATVYRGITVIDPTVRPINGQNTYGFEDIAAIITKGVVWVVAAVAVTPGQPAYFDASGNITNVAASNTAIPGSMFDSTAAAAGLVKLRLG